VIVHRNGKGGQGHGGSEGRGNAQGGKWECGVRAPGGACGKRLAGMEVDGVQRGVGGDLERSLEKSWKETAGTLPGWLAERQRNALRERIPASPAGDALSTQSSLRGSVLALVPRISIRQVSGESCLCGFPI
jgi:hypothetical protein